MSDTLDCIGPFGKDVAVAERAFSAMTGLAATAGGDEGELELCVPANWSLIDDAEVDSRRHEEALRTAPGQFDDDVRAFLLSGLEITTARYEEARARRDELEDAMRRTLGSATLVLPTAPCVAPLRSSYRPEQMGAVNRLTRPFNVTGQPALSIPVPGTRASVQLVGRWNDDVTLLRRGRIFERDLATRCGSGRKDVTP